MYRSINEQENKCNFHSVFSPRYFLKSLDSVYLKARRQAIQKTNLSPDNFPKQCPFSPEDILEFLYLF